MKPRFLNITYSPIRGACYSWRIGWPSAVLNGKDMAVSQDITAIIRDGEFFKENGISSVKLQNLSTEAYISYVKFLKKITANIGIPLIYEVDDLFFSEHIPDYNTFKESIARPERQKAIREILSTVDYITTTTPTLAEFYATQLKTKCLVVKNYAPKFIFDRRYDKNNLMIRYHKNKRPRILYSGSPTHNDIRNKNNGKDDFHHIINFIKKTKNKYQWVFMGTISKELLSLVRSGDIEYHKYVNRCDYADYIDSLKVNAVIAPLEYNLFNECKSNIKYLESACMGIPGVFQDMITYADAPLKFKTSDDLNDQLNSLFSDESLYLNISKESRKYAEKNWLEDNIKTVFHSYRHGF